MGWEGGGVRWRIARIACNATCSFTISLFTGMTKRHLGVVGMLGGIGFTMCLLLTEVAMPAQFTAIPKLAVLVSSAVASIVGAGLMASPLMDPAAGAAPPEKKVA